MNLSLGVYAALHNHAGLYDPARAPPGAAGPDANSGWAAGAWFLGPAGQTLAQMSASDRRSDSREFILLCDIPLPR